MFRPLNLLFLCEFNTHCHAYHVSDVTISYSASGNPNDLYFKYKCILIGTKLCALYSYQQCFCCYFVILFCCYIHNACPTCLRITGLEMCILERGLQQFNRKFSGNALYIYISVCDVMIRENLTIFDTGICSIPRNCSL